MSAAKQAGLDVKYIINEPTAAALYYAFQSGDGLHGHYAVYDLGGGTFDITILKVEGQDIEVITSGGVARLGGDDFDTVLQRLFRRSIRKNGEDPEESDYTKTDAEEDKKSLSKRDKLKLELCVLISKLHEKNLSKKYHHWSLKQKCCAKSIIDEAGIKVSDIQEVF